MKTKMKHEQEATMPNYQVMPELTPEEYDELKADIMARGVMVPIEFDTEGNCIDGHHRLKICAELGITDYPRAVRVYESEEAKFTQARKLNLARRHLSREQWRDLIGEQIKATPEQSDRQIASELGVDHKTVTSVRRELEALGEVPQVDTVIDTKGRHYPTRRAVFNPSARDTAALRDPDIQRRLAENEKMNVASAIREQKRDQLVERLESVEAIEAKTLAGVYDVIVVDPPWPLQKYEHDTRPNQTGLDYPTMSIDEIKALRLPAAADCHVFMWTTQKFYMNGDALDVLKAWNVTPVWCFVWVKDNGIKPFNLPKSSVEFVLYGHIGSPQFVDESDFWSHFNAPTTGHSRKPEAFYDIVRRVTAGRRLDMFGRRDIDGFDIWGNEAPEVLKGENIPAQP